MPNIFLGLGSNQGDREKNLLKAIEVPMFNLVQSKITETEPYGFKEQDCFLNMVLGGTTLLSPHKLLLAIKQIELKLGRKPTFHWGPRVIDIDILFYDDLILHEKDLVIPHPDLVNRLFVLAPLAEIAPTFIHPVLQKTILTLLTEYVA
jgi:2-amino-4-hydroxy-6-hydroxymethyldihydropteridine diphosphokinase